jgi:hypothetical protein
VWKIFNRNWSTILIVLQNFYKKILQQNFIMTHTDINVKLIEQCQSHIYFRKWGQFTSSHINIYTWTYNIDLPIKFRRRQTLQIYHKKLPFPSPSIDNTLVVCQTKKLEIKHHCTYVWKPIGELFSKFHLRIKSSANKFDWTTPGSPNQANVWHTLRYIRSNFFKL